MSYEDAPHLKLTFFFCNKESGNEEAAEIFQEIENDLSEKLVIEDDPSKTSDVNQSGLGVFDVSQSEGGFDLGRHILS